MIALDLIDIEHAIRLEQREGRFLFLAGDGSISVLVIRVKNTMDWPQCPGLTFSGRRMTLPPSSVVHWWKVAQCLEVNPCVIAAILSSSTFTPE